MVDQIKEAFAKVKEDISLLFAQLSDIQRDLAEIKGTFASETNRQTDRQNFSSNNQSAKTVVQTTETSQDLKFALEALKSPNSNVSIRNEGVSTDRQTNRQTDNSTGNEGVYSEKFAQDEKIDSMYNRIHSKMDKFKQVSEFLDSLDDIKKDLRNRIKKLTKQEMVIFSSIYQLEEQGFIVDYTLLSNKLGISESCVRDHVQRIIRKSIPIEKVRENNKKIYLFISSDFKRIASLNTILTLRET